MRSKHTFFLGQKRHMRGPVYIKIRVMTMLPFLIEHYAKAIRKHPYFASKLTWCDQAQVQFLLRKVRMITDSGDVSKIDAVSILDEEELEMLEAWNKGDREKAIDEAYDCIAVLFRIIESMSIIEPKNFHSRKGEKK